MAGIKPVSIVCISSNAFLFNCFGGYLWLYRSFVKTPKNQKRLLFFGSRIGFGITYLMIRPNIFAYIDLGIMDSKTIYVFFLRLSFFIKEAFDLACFLEVTYLAFCMNHLVIFRYRVNFDCSTNLNFFPAIWLNSSAVHGCWISAA